MQRGCSTGAKEVASRVFNMERTASSTASAILRILRTRQGSLTFDAHFATECS